MTLPYSALGFGNPESPGGGGGPRSFADSKYGYDKYGNYGIWLRYSRPGTYSSETGLPEVIVGSMWVGLGSYLNGYYEQNEGNSKGKNGWEIAQTTIESSLLTWDLTKNSIKGVQRLSNTWGSTKYAIQDLGKLKLLKGISMEAGAHYIAGLGILITLNDMRENKLNWSNGTDLVMGVVAIIPGPGWVISGVYFLGNMAVEHYTDKSVGDYLHMEYDFMKLMNFKITFP